ncbi:hypothetical protein [Streptomyces filamentosus]|uniref:hypothetical protein n=1 Tax=Streptomyces filamentosus TaxID=67294 RepID=UPI0037CDE1E5
MKATYFYIGDGAAVSARYAAEVSLEEAYRQIGVNVVAGFAADLFTCEAAGWWPMTTPDGEELRVVALRGTTHVLGVVAFVGRGER